MSSLFGFPGRGACLISLCVPCRSPRASSDFWDNARVASFYGSTRRRKHTAAHPARDPEDDDTYYNDYNDSLGVCLVRRCATLDGRLSATPGLTTTPATTPASTTTTLRTRRSHPSVSQTFALPEAPRRRLVNG
ncbi:hypothetical protein B0H11DRAFT_2224337 [Mycena galericulata]|nr:hypothetical protein B0H11DRAFT_2224337 [Mycena galericulata]